MGPQVGGAGEVKLLPGVQDCIEATQGLFPPGEPCRVLVAGSLYLVGGALRALAAAR